MATSKYAVYSAALTLLRETGTKPSRRDVHEALGGTGSMSTIQKHMQAWEKEYDHLIPKESSAGNYPYISDPIFASVVSLHEQIQKEAALLISKVQDETNRRIELARIAELEAEKKLEELKETYAKELDLKEQLITSLEVALKESVSARDALKPEIDHWRKLAESNITRTNNMAKALEDVTAKLHLEQIAWAEERGKLLSELNKQTQQNRIPTWRKQNRR